MVRSQLKIEPIYQLKHRITGAVIILAVAVIAIPLLLKEPTLAVSASSTSKGSDHHSFKSKIEPANLGSINLSITGKNGEIAKPALSEVSSQVSQHKTNQDRQPDNDRPVIGVDTQAVTTRKKKLVLTMDANSDSRASEPIGQPEQSTQEPGQKSTQASPGWAVRVGTFSKSENIESVSALLSSNGLNPRHTTVQTTLGKATRIWLGPYSEKQAAEKISARLKTLTGEKGYVTRQAS